MEKYGRILETSDALHQVEATIVAESVRRNFAKLISMFDRQLADAADPGNCAQLYMLQAKAGAQRGLELSARLIDLLRSVEAKN